MTSSVFRDQPINIHEQLELGRHFGPLHKHATTGVPIEPGLEEVHRAYFRAIYITSFSDPLFV